jgi:hypothetical protein
VCLIKYLVRKVVPSHIPHWRHFFIAVIVASRKYLSVWLNKWGDSPIADKRDIVTKHNASTEMHPSVMTAQPEKRGWKVAEGSNRHLIKLPGTMYVLHRTSCQRVSGKLADANVRLCRHYLLQSQWCSRRRIIILRNWSQTIADIRTSSCGPVLFSLLETVWRWVHISLANAKDRVFVRILDLFAKSRHKNS